MREIKFRGRTEKGKWVYGYYCHIGHTGIEKHYIVPLYASAWYGIEVVPESVGEFTGLKDRNGKDIYEGDILKIDDYLLNVRWDSISAWWAGVPSEEILGFDKKIGSLLKSYPIEQGTIIGNIYENSELLKPEG